MAAYAAVVSLMNTMEQIQNHPRFSSSLNKETIESLRENLDFVLAFMETYNSHGGSRDEIEALETQITSAAHAAEDLIESHIVSEVVSEENFISFLDQEDAVRSRKMASNPSTSNFLLNEGVVRSLVRVGEVIDPSTLRPFLVGEDADRYRMITDQVLSRSSFPLDQQKRINLEAEMAMAFQEKKRSQFDRLLREKIIEDMASIKEKVMEVKRAKRLQDQQLLNPTSAAPSRSLTTEKTTVVGFDGYMVQLLDWLTGQHPDRQIIPITGMGGIGKTTLARMIYEHSLVERHFDVRVWITVSQEYNVKEILNRALSYLGESTSQLDGKDEDELGRRLHKVLFGRRYLIILDDMWSIEIWDKMRFFFPENNEGSRVVVTTRQLDVAYYFGSLQLALSCLNDDESWSLFCKKVFSNECCPSELEMIGKKIVEKCKGLPLSIVVIGGILRKSLRAQEYWENIARGISSVLNLGADNLCFNILSLSYCHMPAHLKPCFLYLGVFPEDHEIRASLLVKLWVAEGFLKPNIDQSLEEVAEGYIKDLVDRNLILVRTLNLNGKTKTFSVHDLLRDLCLRIAEKDKFFAFTMLRDTQGDICKHRRVIFRKNNVEEFVSLLRPSSHTRSIICESPAVLSAGLPDDLSDEHRLLRVLFSVSSSFFQTSLQVSLRFIAYGHVDINSKLLNLQTVIMTKTFQESTTFDIWEMRQLRHLKYNLFDLLDPPLSQDQDDVVLWNLQTLKTVLNFRCSMEVCKRMPNIKKLWIRYGSNNMPLISYGLRSVDNLTKLESLKCTFYYPGRGNFLENISFPTSLKKLTLGNCGLHWSALMKVGLLPHLQVVKLSNVAAEHEWNPVEGEFCRLIFLGIYGCSHLISWRAKASHFPVLKQLVLERLWKLEEIPLDIGEIPTLERISVYDCNISAAISAIEIQKEQENLENHLKVEVGFSATRDLLKFQKKLKEEL